MNAIILFFSEHLWHNMLIRLTRTLTDFPGLRDVHWDRLNRVLHRSSYKSGWCLSSPQVHSLACMVPEPPSFPRVKNCRHRQQNRPIIINMRYWSSFSYSKMLYIIYKPGVKCEFPYTMSDGVGLVLHRAT